MLSSLRRSTHSESTIFRWALEKPGLPPGKGDDHGVQVIQGWVLFKPEMLHPDSRPEIIVSLDQHTELVHSTDVSNLFSTDRYQPQQIIGDLGTKLTPPRTSYSDKLASYSHKPFVVYDNALINFGRILVTRNPDALVDQTCLIFGSSSSYKLLNYASRIFRSLVLVHTAGNLDPRFVRAIQPDYMVAQTNARFVIRVPQLNYCVRELLKYRIRQLTQRQCEDTIKNRVNTDDRWLARSGLAPYHQTLLNALSRQCV